MKKFRKCAPFTDFCKYNKIINVCIKPKLLAILYTSHPLTFIYFTKTYHDAADSSWQPENLFLIDINIFSHLRQYLRRGFFVSGFHSKITYAATVSHEFYFSRSSRPLRYQHPNNILWRVQQQLCYHTIFSTLYHFSFSVTILLQMLFSATWTRIQSI
jgi:hypothetical protein